MYSGTVQDLHHLFRLHIWATMKLRVQCKTPINTICSPKGRGVFAYCWQCNTQKYHSDISRCLQKQHISKAQKGKKTFNNATYNARDPEIESCKVLRSGGSYIHHLERCRCGNSQAWGGGRHHGIRRLLSAPSLMLLSVFSALCAMSFVFKLTKCRGKRGEGTFNQKKLASSVSILQKSIKNSDEKSKVEYKVAK